MKLALLLTTTLLFNTAFSADAKPVVYEDVKEAPKSDATLQKLLSIKGVDTQYKTCIDTGKTGEDLPKCIWDGLDPKQKEQVQQAYAQEAPKDPANSSANTDLTVKSKTLSVDYMSDPAVVALSKVFEKKLEEALYGDDKAQKDPKTIAAVEHSKFIDLYKTELGKTVVNAFTSYCMEVDYNKKVSTKSLDCKDDDKNKIPCPLYILADFDTDSNGKKTNSRQSTINTNITTLKSAKLDKSKTDGGAKFGYCVTSVTEVCYTKETNLDGITENDYKESRTRACTIVDYVKTARKNLIAADQQKDFYKQYQNGTSIVSNTRTVATTDKNSADAITTVTSKEIEDSYQKANDSLKKEMDECVDTTDPNNKKIIDSEKCKKFVSTNKDEKDKALAEFGLRQFALGKTMDDKLNDKTEVEKYLQQEGYDPNKIKDMIKDDTALATIKQEIKDRYQKERDAIIASMADKIKSKTTDKNGFDATAATSVDKMSAVKTDVSSRADELKQLVHFNNIVSSYLEIDKGKGQKERNVASLYAELNNGAKDIKGADADQNKQIGKNANDAGLKQDGKAGGTNLNVNEINTILKYSTEDTPTNNP